MPEKICSKCKRPKDVEKDFHKQLDTPDGRTRICKGCIKEIHNAKREEKKKEKELYLIV